MIHFLFLLVYSFPRKTIGHYRIIGGMTSSTPHMLEDEEILPLPLPLPARGSVGVGVGDIELVVVRKQVVDESL